MQHRSFVISPEKERKALIAILLLALLHGLVYVFIVPPWQHYDEPNHFEYVWLIANRKSLPHPDDYDQNMRREVAMSMIEHGFFDGIDFLPDLESPPDQPIWIGSYTQLVEPPFYYILASVPLQLFQFDDISAQLYVVRLFSLLLFLFIVWMAWGVTAEITPTGHPLRILTPLSLAMVPGFVDLTTAANSDVAAVVILSMFLWGCVRLIRRGFSLLEFIWIVAAAILAYWTKNTVYIALPLLPIVVLLSVLRGKGWRWLAWGLLLAGGVVGLVIVFDWGDSALWYRLTNQKVPTRVESPQAIEGDFALRLEVDPSISPKNPQIRQVIPNQAERNLEGKAFTLGAWMWASEPVDVHIPLLIHPGGNLLPANQKVTIGVEPSFFAFRGEVPKDVYNLWVSLAPREVSKDSNVTVYYDGVVLVEGEWPLDEAPYYTDAGEERGIWGGESFSNLLRNGSAENAWPWVRPEADAFGKKIIPDRRSPSLALYCLLDQAVTSWYYRVTLFRLVRTFWAKFGWGHVPLLGHKPYRVVGVFTLIGLIGATLALRRKRKNLPWNVLLFLGLVLISSWGITWMRGSVYIFTGFFFPVSRYAYPAIIPTLLVLNFGWLELFLIAERRLHVQAWVKYLVYFFCFLALDIYSIVSVLHYFGM